MTLMSKQQIVAASDRPYEDVDVPAWGGTVRVGTIDGTQRDQFDEWLSAHKGKDGKGSVAGFRAYVCAMCIIGEDGQPLFTPQEAEALSRKGGPSLDLVFDVAQRLNGLRQRDVEEAEKNSASGQS